MARYSVSGRESGLAPAEQAISVDYGMDYIDTRSNWSGFSLRDKRGLLLLEIGAAQRHGAA